MRLLDLYVIKFRGRIVQNGGEGGWRFYCFDTEEAAQGQADAWQKKIGTKEDKYEVVPLIDGLK